MVAIILAGVAIAVASVALLYTWRVTVANEYRIHALEKGFDEGFDAVWKRDLDHRLLLMGELITEGLLHAKRREERARGVVRGALKRLDEAGVEDPSVEAEADELGVGDGEDGIPALLPTVHDALEVGEVLYEDSPVPGLDMAEWKAFLGEEA